MSAYPHDFAGIISLHGVGKVRVVTYKVLFLPAVLEADLPFDDFPRLRVEGEIAEVPVRGAWMPVGDGRRYFIVSPDVLRQSGLTVGDEAEMRFRVDDQDHVDMPPALQAAIDADPAARLAWATLTAGKRRMFAFHVASARTAPTEGRRIAEALEAIRAGCTLRDLKKRSGG